MLSILMQAVDTAKAAPSAFSQYSTPIMMVGIFGVMYFFIIRPQQKRAKEQASFRSEMKPGDRIVTAGGMHAKIVSSDAETMLVETEGGQKMRIERTAISPEYTKTANARAEMAKA
jgi:preprotein translocase subunit YajC